jgi:hypothetical protein
MEAAPSDVGLQELKDHREAFNAVADRFNRSVSERTVDAYHARPAQHSYQGISISNGRHKARLPRCPGGQVTVGTFERRIDACFLLAEGILLADQITAPEAVFKELCRWSEGLKPLVAALNAAARSELPPARAGAPNPRSAASPPSPSPHSPLPALALLTAQGGAGEIGREGQGDGSDGASSDGTADEAADAPPRSSQSVPFEDEDDGAELVGTQSDGEEGQRFGTGHAACLA